MNSYEMLPYTDGRHAPVKLEQYYCPTIAPLHPEDKRGNKLWKRRIVT